MASSRRLPPRSASMGPRSDNRGYAEAGTAGPDLGLLASMGPRSDNRGYGQQGTRQDPVRRASMGPRSDNRGYVSTRPPAGFASGSLQWVHGRITVVMAGRAGVWVASWPCFNGSTVG